MFLLFVFDTFHRAIFHLRPRGCVRGRCLTLEHFPSISATRSLLRNAGCSLALPPQVATRGDNAKKAWRRARPRASAPEMSTIVRAGEERRGNWTGPAARGAGAGGEVGSGEDTQPEEVGGEGTSGDLRPLWRWGCPVPPHHTPCRSQAGAGGAIPTPPLPAARL